MSERPYIGVTGPTTTEEVKHLVSSFERHGVSLETEHQPMIGFLVSHKTLNGQDTANRRYPAFAEISRLLEATEAYSFNTIHYNSRDLVNLGDQIRGIFTGEIYDDQLCRGLQLNIPWPPLDQLVYARRSLPDVKIIMQLSQHSLKERSPQEVARLLAEYGSLIDYTLIDRSGGTGKVFQTEDILPYYFEIRDQLPNLAIGVAGGFTGDNVVLRCQEVIDVIASKDFSIDAEGGLRDKITEDYGDDIYNPDKVDAYVEGAAKVLL